MKTCTMKNKELVAILNGLAELKKTNLNLEGTVMYKIVKNRSAIEKALDPYIQLQMQYTEEFDRSTEEGNQAYLKEMIPVGEEDVTIELDPIPLTSFEHSFFNMDGMFALMCMIE